MKPIPPTEVPPTLRQIVEVAKASGLFPGTLSRADFLALDRPPKKDTHVSPDIDNLMYDEPKLEAARYSIGAREVRNAKFYPPQSRMGWHTNSNYPGLRRYYTYSEQGGGIFRFQSADGTIVDSVEPPGWVMREFEIPRAGLLWHTVYAPVARWSFGFLMGPTAHRRRHFSK